MNKKILLLVAWGVLLASPAAAHVVVRPDTVGVGAFQTFTVSVPSEKDLDTTEIRLALPDGLASVTPTVKPGWNIEVLKHKLPDGDHPYEIVWKGGKVPAHFRDEFTFSSRVPTEPTTLQWNAYQKYSDGSVVSWDLASAEEQPKKPDGSSDFSKFGPSSRTEIVDDLSGTQGGAGSPMNLAISVTALVVALASFAVSLRKK